MLRKIFTPRIKADLKILLVSLFFAAAVGIGFYARPAQRTVYVSDPAARSAAARSGVDADIVDIVDMKNGSLGIVDINSASASELTSLNGIGKVKAAAIVELRDEVGEFKSPEDLVCVRGIGPGTLDAIRDFVAAR